MKKIILAFFGLTFAFIICSNNREQKVPQEKEEPAVESFEVKKVERHHRRW